MIQIKIGRQELIDRINKKAPKWIARALVRTGQYAKARRYDGGSEFWGNIKDIYIEVQHEKCAYCETKLQGAVLASKVHEVEHFRPKSSVNEWPDRGRTYWKDFPTTIRTGGADARGYFLLAYHPFNYAIACTRCNSTLKSNYFPIRGTRNTSLADPSQDASEDSLLIYPLSDLSVDPRKIITFDGVLAVPVKKKGPLFERALTTIWFFQLNHEDLTSRRAEMLIPFWSMLEMGRNATRLADRKIAEADVALACSASGQFSACLSAFRELYSSDHSAARAIYMQVRAL